MKRDQFTNRYIIKIASSILIAVVNIVVQMLLPRAISKEAYGYYTYDMNTFVSLVVLANLSTSNAMVAKFSKRNEEIGILRFYLIYFSEESVYMLKRVRCVRRTVGGGTDRREMIRNVIRPARL